jgi:uncharacterized protein (TIGR03086 family)
MDKFTALDRATAEFAAILAKVADDQWATRSANPGWTVRDLVNHVVGGNRRYVLLLTGAPTVEVEALRDLDHLGTDPVTAFDETSAEVVAAFHAPGAMTRVVHHRLGDRSGAELLVMRLIEHAVHGWDLARSVGADDEIDPEITRLLLSTFDSDPDLLARTSFVPGRPPPDADPQRRLLILTGRAG